MNRYSLLFIAIVGCSFCPWLSTPVYTQHGDEPGVVSLAPVVVTAEQILEYVKNHPQNVVVLDQEEIKERNFLGLGEALDAMPGVEVRRRGGGIGTRILIRGSGGSGQVSVLVDGRAINSAVLA
ncbi:MAG: TonB-dependent receptor plug domain-containing protein [Thermodesulfobacteriota bacterium]|nr:TonB-dependent receptor plug domain-containing protein [Thermodesulfobacteriota bacterium]